MRSFEPVCVVGSGFLGTQIGVTCARHGYIVNMHDISKVALLSSEKAVDDYVLEWVDVGDVSEDEGKRIKSRIRFHEDLANAAHQAGMVIEAVVERLDIKREVFKRLDELCRDDAVIATNSSSIRVSKLEDATSTPQRVLNMHFYGYPWRRRIVELMRGSSTSNEVMERSREFCRSIGLYPLMVLRESTGFIFNRVWRAVKKECLRVVDQGVASFEDVDRAWMSLYDTTMGPFGMMDRVGLDVVWDIEMVYYEESGEPSDAPPGILLRKIELGELGVKTGKGFYSYPNPNYMKLGWLYGDA